jgi:protein-tyrosine-phosphatase
LTPAEGLDPALVEFMDERGMDVGHKMPSPFRTPLDSLQPYHVIVALEEGVLGHITEVPFRTIVLEWAIDIPEGFTTEVLEDLYKMVAVRIQDLMRTLAGPDAH